MALLVRWAASGENAVVFSDEEFQALVEERGNTIKALKLELASRGFGSRFCLRLLHAGEHLEVGDDVVIVPPLVLKMVKLAFLPADEGRDQMNSLMHVRMETFKQLQTVCISIRTPTQLI